MIVNNSERLNFELMTSDDANLLFELNQDPTVMKYINGGKPTSIQEVKDVDIPRMLRYRNEKEGWGLWKVKVIESSRFIGWILVRPMGFFSESPEYNNIELGWRFTQNSWGKGFATEAALNIKNALIENAQQANIKLSKLSAIALEDNLGSISIMKKLGMNYFKKAIHSDVFGDTEVVFYQLEIKS